MIRKIPRRLGGSLIGRPYVWGAEGPNSFDCYGFTQYVFNGVGIKLPRRAVNQANVGRSSGRRLRRGDLVFFASGTRRSLVTHLGIYEADGVMINASQRHGRVRRAHLDEVYWNDRFMFARRLSGVDSGEVRERPENGTRTGRRTAAPREAARAGSPRRRIAAALSTVTVERNARHG